MAYRFSERHLQDRSNKPKDGQVDLFKLAIIFAFFGVLSLITAAHFRGKGDEVVKLSGAPEDTIIQQPATPFLVKRNNEVFDISVRANLPLQSWSFIEGQILDANQEYLFSFGKELWFEEGRDSQGYYWKQKDTQYSLDITLPQTGLHHVQFLIDSEQAPSNVRIEMYRQTGSSIPHFWFGVICLVIAICLNEQKNWTISNLISDL